MNWSGMVNWSRMVDRFMNGGSMVTWSRCVNWCMTDVGNCMSRNVSMACSQNCYENDKALSSKFENHTIIIGLLRLNINVSSYSTTEVYFCYLPSYLRCYFDFSVDD